MDAVEPGKLMNGQNFVPEGKDPSKNTVLKSEGRDPLQASKDMKGKEDISRHERAEEAIRQHFRNIVQKQGGDEQTVDKTV